jgi:KGK domain
VFKNFEQYSLYSKQLASHITGDIKAKADQKKETIMNPVKVYIVDEGDVIRREEGKLPFINEQTCLATDLRSVVLKQYPATDARHQVFCQGLKCVVLRPGEKHWLSGKLRFVLELELDIPEESDSEVETNQSSSLDELRRLADG